ncbi:MAG: acetylglutamate kinase [Spirochaetaceae bacterium]|jgi:acetylglutamate kinase|nr:acetylglutamate kinase [Spirochaetaceae bacterium]
MDPVKNKIIVVKYGGNAMRNNGLMEAVAADAAELRQQGARLVLVHGGGPEIDALLGKMGLESRFVNGLRYTDAQAMEAVQMALCGKINKNICALIQSRGADAAGLCGIDGALFTARKRKDIDLGMVGDIVEVRPALLHILIAQGFVPVVSSVALGIDEEAGLALNINADTAASSLAAAAAAEELVIMTDISGLMRDVNDDKSLIRSIRVSEIDALKAAGVIQGGMIPKIDGCVEAIERGVKLVRIIDGRIPHILRKTFCGGFESGTVISK